MSGCKRANMYSQAKSENWDRSNFFPDGQSMRLPVAGTAPRAEPNLPVPQPATITAAMVERGHERFNIFCTPCHGRAGDGQGIIVQRGFPQPPDFASAEMRRISAQTIYNAITYGRGAMYSHADRVPPSDRWAIAAYIRALQLSRGVAVASLAPADRAKLDDAPIEPPERSSVQPDSPIGSTTSTTPGAGRDTMPNATMSGDKR
ncbi:MAG: c-type cytochrome [Janthinobacterium lividum]